MPIDRHRPHCLSRGLKVKVALFFDYCNGTYRALHCIMKGRVQGDIDYE